MAEMKAFQCPACRKQLRPKYHCIGHEFELWFGCDTCGFESDVRRYNYHELAYSEFDMEYEEFDQEDIGKELSKDVLSEEK